MSEAAAAPVVDATGSTQEPSQADLPLDSGDQGEKSAVPPKPQKQTAGKDASPKPKPPPAQKLKRKMTVDGKETEIEASEDELWSALNQQTVSRKRYEDAAKLRKEAQSAQQQHNQVIELLKQGKIRQAISGLNPDLDATEALAAELNELLNEQDEMADPATRAMRKAERERDEYKDQLNRRQYDEDVKVFEASVQQKAQEFETQFEEALGLVNVPKNDITMRLFAEHWKQNRDDELGLTPAQLASEVEASTIGLGADTLLAIEDDEALLDKRPDLTKRYHKALLARGEKRRAAAAAPPPPIMEKQPQIKTPERTENVTAADKLRNFRTI